MLQVLKKFCKMENTIMCFLITHLLLHYVSAMTLTNVTTDEAALVSLKSQIVSDPFHLLDESWSPSTSVCRWVGITCGTRHQRVKSLNLSNMALTGRIPPDIGNLTFLVSLDLSSNIFYGDLPQEMARLRRLRFLNVSYNNFSGDIPSSFSNVSMLETFDLKFNSIQGEIPTEIGNLKKLRFLDLSKNKLIGSIPVSISNASKLESLDLSSNLLHGNIPEEIGHLHNLNNLEIEFNHLTGSVPFSIFNISRLIEVGFSDNSLSGNLPPDLCNHLPGLKILGLSFNKLQGQIPTSLPNCSQLHIVSLSGNEMDGPIPNEIGSLRNLKSLILGTNHYTGIIPQGIGNLVNLEMLDIQFTHIHGSIPISIFNISSLEYLSLLENNLTGSLPQEIGTLTKMQYLDIRGNTFTGEIPKGISNLTELETVMLGFNSFSGSLPMGIFNISGLRVILLTDSNLPGILPSNIGSALPNIEQLYLARLNLVGTIPRSISNCSKLTLLDLGRNKLTGLIPDTLGYLTKLHILVLESNKLTSDTSLGFLISLANCTSLEQLVLSGNPLNGMLPVSTWNRYTSLANFVAASCKIKGRIPNEVGNLSSLLFLDVYGNNLIGSIPTSIRNMRNLQRLDLSNNKLTGFIGDNLCELPRLDGIYLSVNELTGSLPNCLGNVTSLREIYVDSNKLSSSIPVSLWNLKDLLELDLSSNDMDGFLPAEIGNLKVVIYIDLSGNKFSGGIPREIGGLQNLIVISLRDNKLQESIPDLISNALSLEILDLSHNNISGSIPKSMEKLKYLKYFNVSYNNLYGEIPSGGPFRTLSGQFFLFNKGLCGSSRFSVLPCSTSPKPASNKKKVLLLYVLLGIVLVLLPMAMVFTLIRYRRGKQTPQQSESISTSGRISYYELLEATDSLNDSNLIGYGSFGCVYKGILRSGTPIAVKVFNLQLEAAFKSFDTECEVLRSLRHRNLTKVITSCSNLDFKALVLEYMPNGSLNKWLYSHNYFLDIMQRLSIMTDVACALEYLHHGSSSPVIHCDLKPSNVLLDEDMVGHLSDFGISKLLGEDESVSYTETLATLGYVAPEYGLEGLVSTKCDVYSYGIMLMETFTRTKPHDEMFDGELSLKQWVSNSLPEAVMDVVDANLVTTDLNKLDCVASIMKVALDCCVESPATRTDMKDVVVMLNKIKLQLLAF